MDPVTLGGIFSIGTKLIERLFPDKAAQDAAKLELLAMEKQGELKEMELSLSAIIAEAQSSDPWTSRARPSFLYVVYILILAAIPMGVLTVFNPAAAVNLTAGFSAWLVAIPESMLTLFGVVMTGYVAGRSYEKVRGIK